MAWLKPVISLGDRGITANSISLPPGDRAALLLRNLVYGYSNRRLERVDMSFVLPAVKLIEAWLPLADGIAAPPLFGVAHGQ